MHGTGSKTTYHSCGVHIEVTSVLDFAETTIDALQAGRQGSYRIEVDGETRGFIEHCDGGWRATAFGQPEGDQLAADELAAAAREAAELLTGRLIR